LLGPLGRRLVSNDHFEAPGSTLTLAAVRTSAERSERNRPMKNLRVAAVI